VEQRFTQRSSIDGARLRRKPPGTLRTIREQVAKRVEKKGTIGIDGRTKAVRKRTPHCPVPLTLAAGRGASASCSKTSRVA
jgi:hypothetical protein